jgi:hypothetical protein
MKNTLRLAASCLGAAALTLATQSAWATDDQPGTVGSTDTMSSDQAGKEGMAGTTQMGEQQKMSLKTELAPHVVVISSSLESAKDQLAGVRAQYELSENSQSRPMTQIKLHTRELRYDLKVAMNSQSQLQSGAKKYPTVAQSGEFRQINSSLSEVNKTAQNWESKSKSSSYWNNKDQVKQDLDNFEKQIDSAISNARSFESKQFDMSTSTG